MGLLKRLVAENVVQGHEETLVSTPTSGQGTENLKESYPEMKQNIHRRLVDKLDLTQLDSISREELESQVREVVETLLADEADPAVGLNRE